MSANAIVRIEQEQMVKGTATAYKLAKRYGVKVAFGTNILFSPDGTSQQSEMVTLLESAFGYKPFEALKMVTADNAKLKLSGPRDPYPDGPLGVIKPGAYADLVLVNGNPLEDLSLVADPGNNFVLIMKDGTIHRNAIN